MLLLQQAAHGAAEAAHGPAQAAHGATTEAAHGAAQAAHGVAAAVEAHGLMAWIPWLIIALPLLGFVLNGLLSVIAARRALPRLPPVGDPYYDHAHDDHGHAAVPAHAPALAHASVGAAEPSEQEGHDHGTDAHPVDRAAAHHDAHAHGHDVGHGHAAHDDHGHDHAPAGPKPFTHWLPSLIAPGVLIAAFALAVWTFLQLLGVDAGQRTVIVPGWSWIPVESLKVDAALQVDPLSILMTLIITGVGSLIHIFSIGYMKEDPGYPRYMAYLNLFVFFMLILVLGANYPLMFVGWEGVGLCSYLLIGFWFKEKANADAGKKAFIVNRIGDFGFLVAMMLLFWNVGALDFQGVNAALLGRQAPLYGGALVTAIALFLFLGAAGKSAQIPLYIWLPDAMAGPTPVSALIHAATMVTAGVYLVARSSVIYTLAPAASLVVALVGALTAIFAASIGLKQWDIKKVLAYSTVSQLGFMFVGVGLGAYASGVFHLMTHAFFKACLFLGSGAVIHAMHHALHSTHNPADAQDMRNMGGLRKYLPWTYATMGIATLAIAGVPPFAGFFSKDEIIGAALLGAEGHNAIGLHAASLLGIPGRVVMGFIWGTLTITAFMTAFYMGRMMIYTFFGENRTGEAERKHLHEGSWTLVLPLVVLAFLSLMGGFLNVEKAVFDHVPVIGPLFNAGATLFGGDAALHHWLHPVLAGSEEVVRQSIPGVTGGEHAAWPIFLAIAIGLGGLALAAVMLGRRRLATAEVQPAYENGMEKTLYNKWYVDEFYDATVVKPVGGLSRLFARFDMGVLDWVVDLFGRLAQLFGVAIGRVQTGQVNTYAFVLIVGVLFVLGFFVAL
ncbi:MAG TPA: NADH-quinone oxidoreductase subunit L [Longimicrobium sp.]|nr:NADH-quinone oxidoreductase subunit L [Longimicrobium sp.]